MTIPDVKIQVVRYRLIKKMMKKLSHSCGNVISLLMIIVFVILLK